jgi:hypothetical protein
MSCDCSDAPERMLRSKEATQQTASDATDTTAAIAWAANERERQQFREGFESGQRVGAEQQKHVPIPMLLWCPKCSEKHVDEGAYATTPHSTHTCQNCGLLWKPALVPTVGVNFLPGTHDGY